jgi:hypothetical protein
MTISIKPKAEQKSPRVSKRLKKSKKSTKKSKQTSTESPKQHLSSVDCHSLAEALALGSLPIPSKYASKQPRGSTKANIRSSKETQSDHVWDKADAQLISVCEEGFSDRSKKRCPSCEHEVSKHPESKPFTIDGIHPSSRTPRLPKAVQQEYMEAVEYMRKMTVQLKQLTELMQAGFM